MSRLYQVRSIRAHKEVDGQTQYLVHWDKYSNDYDSWEPVDNLKDCDKIIEQYKMKVERQATPKRRTRARMGTTPVVAATRRSSRIAMLNTAPKEMTTPQDSDAESNKDFDADNNDKIAVQAPTEAKDLKKRTQQIKRRSQPNVMVAEEADKEKKTVHERRSHANLVTSGSLIDNIVDNSQVLKSYDLRQRVQPMAPPLHPVPSTSTMLSSDEEAEILSRRPVRRGRPPHVKTGVAPESTDNNVQRDHPPHRESSVPLEGNEKPYTVVKSVSTYKVSVQEGNLLVRKQEAKEPTEAANFKQDEEVKPAEPIISDVEEEEIVTPSQTVTSTAATTTTASTTTTTTTTTTTYPLAPKWMYFNSAEFLLALLVTALLFITYWCWNSDVC